MFSARFRCLRVCFCFYAFSLVVASCWSGRGEGDRSSLEIRERAESVQLVPGIQVGTKTFPAWIRRDTSLFEPTAVSPSLASHHLSGTNGQGSRSVLRHLDRGQEILVLQQGPKETRVRCLDGQEGCVSSETVLLQSEVFVATLLGDTSLYSQPDLLSFRLSVANRSSLLFVLRAHDEFSEVDAGGGRQGWLFSQLLMREPREILAAEQVIRTKTSEEALQELERAQLTDTKTWQVVWESAHLARPPLASAQTQRVVPSAELVPPGPEPASSSSDLGFGALGDEDKAAVTPDFLEADETSDSQQ